MDAPLQNLYFSAMETARTPARTTRSQPAAPVPAFFLYGEALQSADERLVHIETIAARSRLHDWNIRPHRHRDLNQLLLIERGKVAARVDDLTQTLLAPAIIVVPPGIVHAFAFQPGTVGVVISFASAMVPELASAGLAQFFELPVLATLNRTRFAATDLKQATGMLLREFNRLAPGRHLALRGLLGALLANAMRLTQASTSAPTAPIATDRELVARFRRLIEMRFREHMAVAEYAVQLCISTSRLRRACLEVCGQSPIAVVHLRMLLEAKRQLRYTTMPIAQVAYHLGFNDPAYFSRFFTRHLRLSPRQYRARNGATMANAMPGAPQ
jgi:AraC family transcriptional regulator, transcriptional activator of pobA